MRRPIALLALLLAALPAASDKIDFTSVANATLRFEDDYDPARSVPHVLKIFLHVETTHDSNVFWVANRVTGVEAELLDSSGNPPKPPDMIVVNVGSGYGQFVVPYGSRLDWLISHGGISFGGDVEDKIAVIVGGSGWLVPYNTASSYTLRIRVRGHPWARNSDYVDREKLETLFEVPATKIEFVRNDA